MIMMHAAAAATPPAKAPPIEDARPSWAETEASSSDESSMGSAPTVELSGFSGEQASTTKRASVARVNVAVGTVASQVAPVVFMIGCQRSGSNWLRTMLSEREDLIAPHPPHVMRDFMPRLAKYGDLSLQANLKILIDHVCAFVERNQVQWLDLHSRPMTFRRLSILTEVLLSIACFHCKEKNAAVQEGREAPERVANEYYLLAVFDAIMNAMTKANGKKIWMCKSMGMSKFHDMLLAFYGKERLRYIYLVRDPRDVCLSFMKTPVGDCHPYAIATKWRLLQNFAARILAETPDLIHQVCYEEVLGNKEAQVAKVVEFMGAREVCRSMRRGSIVAMKNEREVVQGAKKGREAMMARGLSYQFQNLTRGDSFTKGQFKKYLTEMKVEDMRIVESAAYDEMKRLGYEPHLIKTEGDRIEFTEELCEEYDAENRRLVEKMNADLAVENPDDLRRRQIQAAVLEKTTSEHYDEDFVFSPEVDLEDALDSEDEAGDDKGFLRGSDTASFDFHKWPLNASKVGFQSNADVSSRFELKDTETLKLKGGLSVTFAAASQGGYYPIDRTKANQDAFIAGKAVCEPVSSKSILKKKERDTGILFAVFDGHGPSGAECAQRARDSVLEHLVDTLDDSLRKSDDSLRQSPLDESDRVADTFVRSYRRSSSLLESGDAGIDASLSGTTATSLLITRDLLHTANVGDSRCLLIERGPGQKEASVKALTVDHTPDRDDEMRRIEAHGGVASCSEEDDSKFQQKRIWSKSGQCGTAFTRSIGDAIAKNLGVCADPECAHVAMPKSDAIFVLGSDGVFDFIHDDEVSSIVLKFDNPADACRELVGKAWNRWCDSEERTDDITVLVGHVKHSKRGILSTLRRRVARSA